MDGSLMNNLKNNLDNTGVPSHITSSHLDTDVDIDNIETRTTSSRKKDHVELCVGERVTFREKTSGFERVEFIHNALPELDFSDVSTETMFLGKRISFPLQISSMTGGYADAERINCELAEICEILKLPMGVGSQRQALETSAFHASFRAARKYAPSIAITANIGGAEIAKESVRSRIHTLMEMLDADALTVHLNPLQELMQPEGNPTFRGVLDGIEQICSSLDKPIIVKEVGAGLSEAVTRRLLDVGVSVIDVAGAGGTSWAGVELMRSPNDAHSQIDYKKVFWDWGLPTVECLQSLQSIKQQRTFTLVASGGILSGLDVAKSLALGADMAAAARILLQVLMEQGQQALYEMLAGWRYQIRAAMFLTGAADVQALRQVPIRFL